MSIDMSALPRRTTGIFWTALIVLAFVSAVALVSTYRLLGVYSASTRSQQALLVLDRFLSHTKDVEGGARAYALTRNQRFLHTHQRGLRNVRKSLNDLYALSSTEPELKRHLQRVRPIAERRLALAKQLVDLTSTGADERELNAAVLVGSRVMDALRREVGTTTSALQQSYETRRRTIEQQAIIASVALGAGVTVSLSVLTWLFFLFNREVVRRRRAEEELRHANVALERRVQEKTSQVEEARQLLDAVIQSVPDTVILKDAHNGFKYVMVNRAGEGLLGGDRVELLGQDDYQLFAQSDAARSREEDETIARSEVLSVVSEFHLQTKRGCRVVEVRKMPLALDSGKKKFVLAIVRDLTEQKELETQIREMQRLESVGRLTGGVAHDFNNLLAVIMGNSELIREQVSGESETAVLAEETLNAAGRGADLVRRLLAFARKQHLEPIAVDLNQRLTAVVPLLQRTLGEQIRIRVRSTEGLWTARIDPTQVDDAVVNLAINARDAMPDGGALTIETDNVVLDDDYAAHHVEVQPGDYVMLAVSDTGSGMPPEVVARAFEPFFTTKPEGKGTGLGLSQVYGWVKQSGGHIKIYSEVGHGTTVKLYLPRALQDGQAPQESKLEQSGWTGHECVLVVEDNPHVRRTAIRQLADLGYRTIEAEDAQAALEKVVSGVEFDLLLTDIVMPGRMSGYDLAKEVDKLRPGTKVLFTSGYTELASNGLQASRPGPLISKPYTKAELGKAVRLALGQ